MKPKFLIRRHYLIALSIGLGPQAIAASAAWSVDAAGNWATAASWTPAAAPGVTTGTTSGDVATFSKTLTAARIATVDTNRNIGGITFSNTSAFGYTLSGGNLLLSNGGVIQSAAANAAHTDTISSAIAIQGDGGAASFTGNATSAGLLTLGAVTGVSTGTNVTTLTLNGSNTGNHTVLGIIGDGAGGGKLAVTKSGAGTWILSGANTHTGGTSLSAGALSLGTNSAAGTGTLTLGGGTIQNSAGVTIANPVTVTAGTTTNARATTLGNWTLTGALSGTGTFQNNHTTSSSFIMQCDISGFTGTINHVTNNNGNNFTFNGTTAASQNGAAAKFVLSGGTAAANRAMNVGSSTATLFQMGELSGTGGRLNNNVTGVTIQIGSLNTSSTFAGAIVSTAAVTKVGTGTLTLSGVNTYTGATTVNNGTLNLTGTLGNTATTVSTGAFLAGEGSIGATGSLTLNNGATLRVNGSSVGALATGGNLTLNGIANVVLDTLPTTVGYGTNILLLTYGGTLTGTAANLALVPTGYRNPVFSTATSGQVNLLLDTKDLTWSGGSAAWDINTTANWALGAETFYQGDAVHFTDTGSIRSITLNDTVLPTSVTVSNSAGYDYSISGTGSIGSSGSLTKSGAGALTLATANTFTGGVNFTAGTLNVNHASALGSAGTFVIGGGTTLDNTSVGAITSTGNNPLTLDGDFIFTGTQNLNLGGGAASLGSAGTTRTITTNAGMLTIGGILSNGTATGLVKTGSGTLSLGGANTFTGGVTISAGKLIAGAAGALGSGAVANNSTLDLTGVGGTYTGLSTSLTGNGTVNVTLGTGSVATILNGDYSGFTGTWNIGIGAAGGAGKVQMNGLDHAAATLNVLANATVYVVGATHNSSIVLNGGDTGESLGQLRLEGGATWAGSVTLAGAITGSGDGHVGANSGTGTISGSIGESGGSFALVKIGVGTTVLSGTNTYTGGTVANAGSLTLLGNQTAATGGFAVNTANSAPAYVNIGSSSQTSVTSLTVAAGKSVQTGAGPASGGTNYVTLNTAGASGFPSTVTNNGTLLVGRDSGFTVGAYSEWIQNGDMNVQPVGGYPANFVLSAGGTFIYAGANPVNLTVNTGTSGLLPFTLNGTFVTGQAINMVCSGSAFPIMSMSSGGKITLTDNIAQLVTSIGSGAAGKFQLGTGGGVIDTAGFNTALGINLTDVAGQIGSLTKQGGGKLTLSGTNTYSGATTVSAGTLAVSGSLGGTAVDVLGDATLAGNGNIGGSVTVESNGHHALAVAATPGTQVTRVITGTLTLVSGNILDLTASSPPAPGTYVLATAASIINAPTTVNLSGSSGTVAVVGGNSLVLTVSAYANWIAPFHVADASPTGDPDGDGIMNLVEYVLNGNPGVADPAILPSLAVTATNYEFTYTRRDDSLTDTIQTFQYGSTLTGWVDIVVPAGGGSVGAATITVTHNDITDTVKISISKSVAPTGSLFGRLKVTQP